MLASILPEGKPVVSVSHVQPTYRIYEPDNSGARRRLLIVSSNSCIGGVEKVILNLLKYLPREKFHITTVVTEIQGLLHGEYAKYSDECMFMGADAGEGFHRYLLNTKFDIYHIFNSMLALRNIEHMDGKVIMSLFGDYRQDLYWFKMRKDVFITKAHHIDMITCDNPINVGLFYDFPLYLHNGIEIPEQIKYNKSNSQFKICWMGRDSGEKRPDVLVKTARSMPHIKFAVCIANLKSSAGFLTTIADLKVLPNVELYVNADEAVVKRICSESHVYMNTSVMEGMPIAMLEALSFGCVPVVTNAGDMEALVKDMGIGIVADKDPYLITDFSPYIEAGLKILKDGNKKEIYSAITRHITKKYNVHDFVDTILQIYDGKIYRNKADLLINAGRMRSRLKPTKLRLQNFINELRRSIYGDAERRGIALYRALFDLDLRSDPYWYKRLVNHDVTEYKFMEELFYIYRNNYPGAPTVKIQPELDEIMEMYKCRYAD